MTVAGISRKKLGPDFAAKLDTSCRLCKKPIRKDIDFATKVDGVDGTFHSHCARAYVRTIDEHLEDDAA